jgi:hypothetical protein
MFEWRTPITVLGLLLIIAGAFLLSIPYIVKRAPTLERLEKVPAILLYVYRKDSFFFITSPILLILGAVYLIWLLSRLSR